MIGYAAVFKRMQLHRRMLIDAVVGAVPFDETKEAIPEETASDYFCK